MSAQHDNLTRDLAKLSDQELLRKYETGYFADWAQGAARAELTRRNIRHSAAPPSEEDYVHDGRPFWRKHPFLAFLLFVALSKIGHLVIQALFKS